MTMWKVPFRPVYCASFIDMLRQTFWCHAVLRVFPHAHDFGSDALVDMYETEPSSMYHQLSFHIRSVKMERAGLVG